MSEHAEQGAAPRAGRITVEESFLDLVDHLAHGDLETWRRIYATALADPAARAAVERAAGLVDPDLASAGALWRALVERMPPAVHPDSPATESAPPDRAAPPPAHQATRRR